MRWRSPFGRRGDAPPAPARAVCPFCGEEHDLAHIEPHYRRPDAIVAVPPEERELRTRQGEGACVLREPDGALRWFLRALMPMPVHGRARPCHWSIWIEVPGEAWQRSYELRDDPRQAEEPPVPGRVANHLLGYPGSEGLPGLLRLTGPDTIPTFHLAADLDHPLAREQRAGVPESRALEWAAEAVHPRR